jgi:hypothetical protein
MGRLRRAAGVVVTLMATALPACGDPVTDLDSDRPAPAPATTTTVLGADRRRARSLPPNRSAALAVDRAQLEFPTSHDPATLTAQTYKMLQFAYRAYILYDKELAVSKAYLDIVYDEPVILRGRLDAILDFSAFRLPSYPGLQLSVTAQNARTTFDAAGNPTVTVDELIVLEPGDGSRVEYRLTRSHSYTPSTATDPRTDTEQPVMAITFDRTFPSTRRVREIQP